MITPEMPDSGAMPYDESAEDMGETLSQSLLAGKTVKPGDTITIKVVSVDDENGTFKATANDSESAEETSSGGINKMAQAFDGMKGGM